MNDFEQAVLGLLLLQTAILLTMFIYNIVHGIYQEMERIQQSVKAIQYQFLSRILIPDEQQRASPEFEEYQRWTKYPLVVLSQCRLTRKFYLEKLWELNASLTQRNESESS